MSHGRIFAIRTVADSVHGDYTGYMVDWRSMLEKDIKLNEYPDFASFSDHYVDVRESEWEKDIEWLLKDGFIDGTTEYRSVAEGHFVKFKVGALKEKAVKNRRKIIEFLESSDDDVLFNFSNRKSISALVEGDKGSFQVLDMNKYYTEDIAEITPISVELNTLFIWFCNMYNWLTRPEIAGSPLSGQGLKDDDSVFIRIERVIDFHY